MAQAEGRLGYRLNRRRLPANFQAVLDIDLPAGGSASLIAVSEFA
jgi:hypothetical protein